VAVASIVAVVAAMAGAAQSPQIPCAECVAIRVTLDDAQTIASLATDFHGLPVVVTADAVGAPLRAAAESLSHRSVTVGVELPLRALRSIDPAELPSLAVVIVDARDLSTLNDDARFSLRVFATALRAVAAGVRIGVDTRPAAIVDPAIASLRPYLDFIVASPSGDPAIGRQLPGIEIWTSSDAAVSSIVDALVAPRVSGSDRSLISLTGTALRLAARIAELRAVLPAGLTPLPDVAVTCAACDADVFLHPRTLDAVALVRPHAPVSRLLIRPAATAVSVFGDATVERHGAEIDLPPLTLPFVVRIGGWRGETGPAFASDVRVTAARTLTVDEIIARHQAARERQNLAVRSLISSGSTVLTFQVPGFAAPFTVTARTRVFARLRDTAASAGQARPRHGAASAGQARLGHGAASAGQDYETTVEQTTIRVNGLELAQRGNDIPRLPLLEPERVSTPPLAITLTEAYRYRLRGTDSIAGRPMFVVSFEPRAADRTLYTGRVWIDAATFGIARLDASQTVLHGPISSSRQVDDYVPVTQGADTVWLLGRSEIFQTYTGPAESTPIHRVVVVDRRDLNPADFDAQLDASLRSNAVMLRDTPNGYRFLLPNESGSNGDIRRVSASNVERITAAVVGGLFDPNISVPLVFAGISHVDFNLFNTGAQLNVFFGGTYGRFSWSTRPLFGSWRMTGDGAGVALSYNDRSFRGGAEEYTENIRQRPAQIAVALLGNVAPAVRVRLGYDLAYTRYAPASTTAPAFVVPASTPVHGARLALEAEHGAWSVVGWSTIAWRQSWTPWGLMPSPEQREQRRFERFGATVARSIVWSPKAVARIEAAAMTGARLDRFSRFAFGTVDNPLRGYPSVSIRYTSGMAVRSAATWTPSRHVRVDGFADLGMARQSDDDRVRAFPGLGSAIEIPAPFGWLTAVEWGYGIRGVNTNGTTGTHVFRISGYKVF
jgi:hypothetical protein